MLDGFKFEKRKVATGIQIAYRIGGKGQPLLLLHGYPQIPNSILNTSCWAGRRIRKRKSTTFLTLTAWRNTNAAFATR
jgi:hypothetical protein